MSISSPGERKTPNVVKLEGLRRGARQPAESRVRGEMPPRPDWLGKYALDEWDRVVPALYRLGILDSIDAGALEGYCDAYHVWRTAREQLLKFEQEAAVPAGAYIAVTKTGSSYASPLLGIVNKARRDMVRFAAEFGMTPSGRTGLVGAPRVPG